MAIIYCKSTSSPFLCISVIASPTVKSVGYYGMFTTSILL
jgi:hypothetical protein